MNHIILRGRLTADPDMKITTDQKSISVSRFSLAVHDRSHRNHNGEYDVDYIKVVAFNTVADNIHQYTSKGSELLVQGRLHTYSYKNKEGKMVYMAEVIAERIEFVSNCKQSIAEVPEGEDEELPFR